MSSSFPTLRGRFAPSPATARWGAVVLVWEFVLTAAYFTFTPATPTHLRYLVYPFVWIDLGLWSVLRVETHPGSERHRLLAGAVAAGYLVALLYVPGVFQFPIPHVRALPPAPGRFQLLWAAPGWGPLLSYRSSLVVLNLVPFKLVGYASLAYLIYANVLVFTRSSLSGVLGLVTCVSCVSPVFTALAGLLGGGAAVVATATRFSVDLGTLAFVASVALLYWGATARTRT